MAGPEPAIQRECDEQKWMAGPSPAVTKLVEPWPRSISYSRW